MGAVVYPASDAVVLVTGTALMVDGGWTADFVQQNKHPQPVLDMSTEDLSENYKRAYSNKVGSGSGLRWC